MPAALARNLGSEAAVSVDSTDERLHVHELGHKAP